LLSIPPGALRLVVMIEAADPDIASLMRATLAALARRMRGAIAARYRNHASTAFFPVAL
jgi:hypothetical protein